MKLPFLGDWAQTSINSDPASPLSVPDSAVPYLAVHTALKGRSGQNTSRKVQQRREAGQMKRSKEGDPGSRSELLLLPRGNSDVHTLLHKNKIIWWARYLEHLL